MAKNEGSKTAVLDGNGAFTGDEARAKRASYDKPYSVEVTIEGVAHCLLKKYDCDDVEKKGNAKKGSAEKKTDNLEASVYRDPETGEIGIPGVNFKAALAAAAKSTQDPRSPRKSAKDLVRASVFVTPDLASFGKKTWDFEDRRGVCIQTSRVTRVRPAMHKGWRLTFIINVVQPQYITPDLLEQIVKNAGAFCGLGDFRPDFGRFTIRKFDVRDFCDVQ